MANLKSVIGRLRKAYRDWEAGADKRMTAKVAKAATKGVRESQLHVLKVQKLERKREMEETIARLKEAEAKRKKAERELKQSGNGILSRLLGTSRPKTIRRATAKRKVKRKATRKTTEKPRPRSVRLLLD